MNRIKLLLIVLSLVVITGCNKDNCPKGYELKGEYCQKEIGNTEAVDYLYCPDTYDSIEEGCYKKEERVPQKGNSCDAGNSCSINNKYCEAGFELIDNICVKEELIERKVEHRCPNGYEYVDNLCRKYARIEVK